MIEKQNIKYMLTMKRNVGRGVYGLKVQMSGLTCRHALCEIQV